MEVLLLELVALQLVGACSIVVRKMAGSLASLVGEGVVAYSTVVHKMAGSLASLVEEGVEAVLAFRSIQVVADIELDNYIVVLEEVLA